MASHNSYHLLACAGEYYVCAELCRLGYLALLSPKNHPVFDVIVTNAGGTASVSIQVKTKSGKQGWRLSASSEVLHGNPNLFVVLVDLSGSAPEFYPFHHDDLAARIASDHSAYKKRRMAAGAAEPETTMRCFKISQLTEGDKARKNRWDSITELLKKNKLRNQTEGTKHKNRTVERALNQMFGCIFCPMNI